jgi:hypothetical protein
MWISENQWVVLTQLQRVFGHPGFSIVIAARITHFFQPFERLLSTRSSSFLFLTLQQGEGGSCVDRSSSR